MFIKKIEKKPAIRKVSHVETSKGFKIVKTENKTPVKESKLEKINQIKDENKKFYEQNPNIVSSYSSINPLKRMLKAEDIVKLISFLFSKKSNFINGEIIRIDGGVSLLAQESLVRMLCGI